MVLKLLSAIVKQILLIGDTSVPEALGTKLKRGAEQLGISEKFKISVSYHSPALNYSPSMGTKRGKILYRLAGKRSLEWWGYQQNLLEKIKELKNSGLGYRKIAYWLNDNSYKTPIGRPFKNTHVFSILKKRRLRDERYGQAPDITIRDVHIKTKR